ncbi:MAG: hypothetical protein GY930_01765 [bacterium]|nr:hypothetical protein [bacterium]
MKSPSILMAALLALSSTAVAGEIQITQTGSAEGNCSWVGGAVWGDFVEVSYTVTTPGTVVTPGQHISYDINLASFDIRVNGVSTGLTLNNPTTVHIRNDNPGADGINIFTSPLSSGGAFSCGFGATAALWNDVDLEQMIGTYNAGPVLTSFDFVFQGAGCFMEVFPEQVIIETPPVGVAFCDPGTVNSTGNAAVLSGTWGSGTGSELHLECTGGVPGELGYFLVGDTANDPGTVVSNGEFCLIGGMSQFFRYNVAGTTANSVGLFDAAGVLQNAVGTSTVGSGFDVPNLIPGSATMIMAGDTWHFQAWHRDTLAGTGQSNFSNGYSVTF